MAVCAVNVRSGGHAIPKKKRFCRMWHFFLHMAVILQPLALGLGLRH